MIRYVIAFILLGVLFSGCVQTDEGVIVRTADPNVAILFTFPHSPSVPVIEPEVFPEEEVGEVDPNPTLQPPSLDIKGNISSSGEKIYHLPGGAYYDQVKIDEAAGEMWFRTEEEAVAAGWRKSSR